MYYGILAIMALYNMLLYFYVRERVYLYYVLYVLSCMIFSLTEDGLGFHLLWSDFPIVNSLIDNSSQFIFLQCFILLYRQFFDFEHRMPAFAKKLQLISLSYLVYFIVSLPVPYTLRNALSFVYMVPILLIYAATFRLYLKGFRKVTQFFFVGIYLYYFRDYRLYFAPKRFHDGQYSLCVQPEFRFAYRDCVFFFGLGVSFAAY